MSGKTGSFRYMAPEVFCRTTVCVRILLYICSHTAIYVSAHCHICVRCFRILLYLCPQVFSDTGEYTPRVDVYSGSLVVWYVFMGVPPLAALSGQEVLR